MALERRFQMMKKKRNSYQLHRSILILAAAAVILFGFSSEAKTVYAQSSSKLSALGLSNDQYSDTQWYIDNPGKYTKLTQLAAQDITSTQDIDMDIVEAWEAMANAGLGAREVIVAVIDTGVDYQHPELADHMWINEAEIPDDNIDNDNNGYVDDVYGWDFYNNDNTICHYIYSDLYHKNLADPNDNDNHGTHVAGVIAATMNNNLGIAGIASNINVKIMSLKINGGKNGSGDIANAVKAIKYATMMGADICNLSWGTNKINPELEAAMKESNMLFVAAAGNDGSNIDDTPLYPASLELDNLISVTFIDADGDLTGYSNFGKNSVDIAAPGNDIFSTIVGSYSNASGSSMAAPQVSAVAALLYEFGDNLYASNVKDIILGSLKEIGGLKDVTQYGGIPSAYKAVLEAGSLLQDTQAPELSFRTEYNQGDMTVFVDVVDKGGSKLRVVKWMIGEKELKDFEKGTIGTTVVSNQVDLTKGGYYTFYAADYAGNEVAQTYEVIEDTTAPKLSAMFTVAADYKTRTVTVLTSDSGSGLKRVEFMEGNRTTEDFLPADAGTVLKISDGKGKFTIKKDGTYTIFAVDNRGNMSVKKLVVKTTKSTGIKLNYKSRTMGPGDTITLRPVLTPSGSTDTITYVSSNKKVAKVSVTGKVIALKSGKAYITARTASGLTVKCLITVSKI
jgi:hypothetical protein